ncbi:MAG: hypothetical protein K5668_02395 [Lachnospiraceae bacterium]|nr:hypothetical protein [Lachnospiraceae bacterium]
MNKKVLVILITTMLMAGLMQGCNKADTSGVSPEKGSAEAAGQAAEEAQAPTAPKAEQAAAAEEENEEAPDENAIQEAEMPEESISIEENPELLAQAEKDYQEILEKYKTALQEGWDGDKLIDNGLSYMLIYSNDEKDRDKIGYMITDINKDGIAELFIGRQPEEGYQDTIYQAYTLKKGKPVILIDGGERDCYYLCVDGSSIFREGSSGASDGFFFSYVLDPEADRLRMVEGLLYDENADKNKPWFFVQTDDFDASMGQPVSEEDFNMLMDGFVSDIGTINFKPFGIAADSKESSYEKKEEPAANSGGGYTTDELCKMAQDYYEKHNNFRPPVAEGEEQDDGMILIHLYEQLPTHTATSAWYMIDPKTGKGYDYLFEDAKVDLTEVK